MSPVRAGAFGKKPRAIFGEADTVPHRARSRTIVQRRPRLRAADHGEGTTQDQPSFSTIFFSRIIFQPSVSASEREDADTLPTDRWMVPPPHLNRRNTREAPPASESTANETVTTSRVLVYIFRSSAPPAASSCSKAAWRFREIRTGAPIGLLSSIGHLDALSRSQARGARVLLGQAGLPHQYGVKWCRRLGDTQ